MNAEFDFTISDAPGGRVLTWKEGGARPATEQECLMWDMLRAQQAVLQESEMPSISEEDRQLLHYNPNTDDVIAFMHAYARQYAAQQQAASAVPLGFLMTPEDKDVPVFVPLDRTATNADDLYGWKPVFNAAPTPTAPADVLQRDNERMAQANAGLVGELKAANERNHALEARTHARFRNEECWIWQGDGSDELESLTCPVVIRPEVLAALMAPADVMADALRKHADWCDQQAASDWHGRTAGDMARSHAAQIAARAAEKGTT